MAARTEVRLAEALTKLMDKFTELANELDMCARDFSEFYTALEALEDAGFDYEDDKMDIHPSQR